MDSHNHHTSSIPQPDSLKDSDPNQSKDTNNNNDSSTNSNSNNNVIVIATNVANSRPINGEDLMNIRMVSGRTIAHPTGYPGANVVVTTDDDDDAMAASVRSSEPSRLGPAAGQQSSPIVATNETAISVGGGGGGVDTTSQSTTAGTITATTATMTDAQEARLKMVASSSSGNSNSSSNIGGKILNQSTLNAKIAKTSKLKFLILGAQNVGKTLILRRMQNINWPLIMMSNHDQYRPTVGPDLHRLKCGTIEAIDIGGEERFVTRAKKYCELFTVFMIVFDVNNAETFLMARYWMDFLHTNPLINVQHVVLVGNKTDLGQPRRKVSIRMAKNLALTFNAGYLEISAKLDLTMDKVFETLEAKQPQPPPANNQSINIAH